MDSNNANTQLQVLCLPVVEESVTSEKAVATGSSSIQTPGKVQVKKRKIASSKIKRTLVNSNTQTEIILEDQACQTDLPYYPNSPQTMKSFSLVDLRHAVTNDHSYASSYGNPIPSSNDSVPNNLNNIFLGKSCQKRLQFTGIEAKYTDLNEEQSDDERLSEISDSEEFYFTDTESDFSEESSDLDEIVYADMTEKKSKVLAEEQEEESTNWLEANCGDLHEERKFIVFESKLKDLLSSSVCCPNCGRKVKNMTLTTKGSVATIENLGCCQNPMRWQTQPFVKSMAAGNLLLSAGILFTGNDYSNIASLAKATNMQFFSETNYNDTQKKFLFPTVNKKFVEHQAEVLREVQNTEVVAGGDACCDSPGHSAKYGTYSIVDTESSKVLDFSLLQVTEVKNSNALELEGLK